LAKKPEDRPFNARCVQGIMLQIASKYNIPETGSVAPSQTKNDVSAGQVNDVGQRMLKRHIEARLGTSQRKEVSWQRLWGLITIVLLLIAIFALARK